jgi:hypothetical protein
MQRSDFLYQPFYCEENIWQLCQQDAFHGSHAIFISARGDTFPMLCQQASFEPAVPLLWDYHVVLLTAAPHRIVDFDTTLPFCSDIGTYFRRSFIDEQQLPPEHIPYFRIVPAAVFAEQFRSDRSHMKTATGWHAEPPPWPQIGAGGSNLLQIIDPDSTVMGEVLRYAQVLARFG